MKEAWLLPTIHLLEISMDRQCSVPGCNQLCSTKTGSLCEEHRKARQRAGQERTTLILICKIRRSKCQK